VPEKPLPHVWESCLTMGDQWSYKPGDKYKSTPRLIHLLVDIVAKGGNFLLNVGPQPDGELPPEAVTRLREMGAWLAGNGEAIYGTRPIAPYREGLLAYTRKGQARYAIYLPKDENGALPEKIGLPSLRPAAGAVVQMLGVAAPLSWEAGAGGEVVVKIPEAVRKSPPCQHAWVLKWTAEK
jgi:alpha-L-fucosidase